MTLTKTHIIKEIRDRNGYTLKKSADTVETIIDIIKRSLESGENVLISGFGKFCVKEKKERRGRNPSTGQDLMLGPRKVVTFRCSGILRERINSGQ
ncbi:integration host factor subunit alpha [Thermodesulfobacteriota bacterium]